VQPAQVQTFVENKLAGSSRGFLSGRNIFIYNYGSLGEAIVQNFSAVKNAQVKRDTTLGNGLKVIIEERSPFALWCGTSCYILDDQGVVFAPDSDVASSSLPSQYVFSGELSTSTFAVTSPPYGEVFAGEHFTGINDLLNSLHTQGLVPTGAAIVNDSDFSVPLTQGFYIKASYGEDPNALTKNLMLILGADALKGRTSDLEYVDLRFGNRIYYKFKSDAQLKSDASTAATSSAPTVSSTSAHH
jgi:hypothetical protein